MSLSNQLIFMGKWKSFTEFCRIFAKDVKEDWDYMDRKLIRILIMIAVFVGSALFMLYFFQNSSPFSFG